MMMPGKNRILTKGIAGVMLTLFFLFTPLLYSQTDWEKWDKAEVKYTIEKAEYTDETKVENPGLTAGALSLLRGVYAFFISGHDGDNCPFYPSCSNFYVLAVKEAGIVKGTLMFADRFTRDLNMLKRQNQYPMHISGRFYDPPKNHTLIEDKIIYSSAETTVKK